MGEQDRVAVGSGLRAQGGADAALGAAAVVDDHLLSPGLVELRSEDAGERVGSSAGRKRHDKANGFLRKLCRKTRSGEAREPGYETDYGDGNEVTHGISKGLAEA